MRKYIKAIRSKALPKPVRDVEGVDLNLDVKL